MSSLNRFEDISRDCMREFFMKTRMREVLHTVVDLVKSYNLFINRNKECIINNENIK